MSEYGLWAVCGIVDRVDGVKVERIKEHVWINPLSQATTSMPQADVISATSNWTWHLSCHDTLSQRAIFLISFKINLRRWV